MAMKSGRTLIVDDEKGLLKLLCEFLSGCGYTVTAYISGREALDSLRKQTVDLILIDLILPDMDGINIPLKRECLVI